MKKFLVLMLLSFSYFGMAQASKDVSFSVDMNGVTSSFTNVYVSGTMNSWSGNANQLTDADGDGIYEGKIALSPGSYEYKFTYDNWVGQESLDATLDSACTLTTGSFTNRFITIDSTSITNTSFDDEPVRDDNREDWRNSALESHADSYFGNSDYVLQMSTTERSGTWAGKLPTAENSSKPRRWIYQEVAVTPNTNYEILGYIRNKDENIGSTVTFQIYDAPFDSAQVIDDTSHILSSADFDSSTGHDTDVFTPATITFNSGNNDTVVLLITNDYTLNVSGENSESFVDDVTISTVLPTVCWEACVDCSTANAYTATSCGDLFFSEYAEGSSNNKYFEIYNPTSAAISLSGYTVYLSGNGGSYTNTFTSNASIASGDVYMISTNSLDSATQALADTAMGYPSVAHYNGDDALILMNGTDTIDVIGTPGVDPGSSWSVGTGSTKDHTLIRKASVDMGSTDWTTGATEWDVYAQNTWSYAGAHSSSCIVTPKNVTFQVDMTNVTASFTNVYVSGTVNNWSGNSNQLTDADGDGVYEGTLSLMPGSYEYKFTYDNWTGQESLDATLDSACTLTTGAFTNRYATFGNADTTLPVVCWEECSACAVQTNFVVTFMVNSANITVGTNGLYLGGGVIGGANAVQLADPDGDGIYVGTDTLNGSTGGNFIFLNSPTWSGDWGAKENLAGLACADASNYNDRILPTFTQDTTLMFCYGNCSTDTSCTVASTNPDVTFRVDMSNVSASFTNVYVSGTLNSWSGNANQLTDADGDGVYEGDINIAAGNYEFKFTYDNWVGQESLDATLDSACTLTTGAFTNRYITIGASDTTLPVYCWEECTSCASTVTGCSELFFSEYSEGSSNNKYIEIYNPTANAVSLSTYTVYQSGNGGSYTNTFTTNATIQSGDVYLIAANQADATILAAADTAMAYPSIAHFNGDDAMILVSGTDTIDVIGVPGVDPGSSWTVGTGSTANHTLVRKATVDMGSTDWTTGATEWDVYSQNTWTYKGAHTSNCIATQTDFVVTFMVNTANITVGTNGLYLGGGVIGGANAVQLADPDGDGIYVGTDTLNGANGGNFIFLNNPANASDWNAKENLTGLSCADPNNYNDRILPTFTQDTTLMFCFGTCSADTSCSVTATYPDVTFSVDMNNVSASFTNVYVSGTLNSWSGNANQLTDPDGDGVYDADISLAPGNYEFKFTYDNWVGQENLDPNTLDSNCTLTTGAFTNRYISVGVADTTLPVYCWEECVACAINVPTYTIDQIDNTDADGVPDSLNVYCKVIGVVHGVDMQGSSSAVSFTVHDGTGGLGTYSSVATVASYTVTEGDEVRIVGDIGHFNGLLQMYVDSVTVISTGNATQTPTVVTSLGESTESELVKFENMTMVDPTQWGSGSSGYNIDITNGTDTVVMRIDADVDLYGAVAPVGMFDVVGIGGQYDFSAPHFDGYQLLPRYQADIMPSTGGGSAVKLSISEIMSGSNSTAYNADWFEIHNYGDSAVDLGGFSWDDESEIPGTSTFPMVTVQPGQAIVVLDDVAANKDAFLTEWKLYAGSVTIVANDELTGSFPSLSQNGDAVFLYDANGAEMASGVYTAATAGFSVEFDTTGAFLGDAVDGTNGAYTSLEGDVGSPGNLTPNTGFGEAAVISSIFPNPTTGSFTVNLVSDVSYDATITNITGATVFQKVGTGAVLNIDLNTARGTYVLRVRTAQGTAVQMIVLQ
ncbi:lamin tail domain-containing protein [Schleiferiaceae bacterium]|nr:lamin tail domain-containing protein [Schleiferiaceae bacterium]